MPPVYDAPSKRLRLTPISLLPLLLLILLAVVLAGCAEHSRLPDGAGMGPQPTLPAPTTSLLPTVNIAPAEGWPSGRQPDGAAGLRVTAFATGLVHPRWLLVLPGGDLLVAETNAPPRPEDGQGLKGWVMKQVMARAGAAVPSPNRITLLRDADGDGHAETRTEFVAGLNSPFGMVLVQDRLYIANTDAVLEYRYTPGQTQLQGPPRKLTDLPAGPRNHHWTKALVASPDGSRLYATVGSNSNVAENGMPAEEGRAAVWEIDRQSGQKRLFATGLRNPNGMAWVGPGTLWTVVNERDELGSDLVPDYLTAVHEGGFYGWPYSWFGQHLDQRVSPQRPDLVTRALVPDYALGTHVAPLGLAWADGGTLPGRLVPGATRGMFVGLHGSWNRRPAAGYKVVFVPFNGQRPQGLPVDVLTGFLGPDGQAFGRPVGVALDARGALLVADDVGNAVWRISAP
jgi:glucose/arabinose dehydrogenase